MPRFWLNIQFYGDFAQYEYNEPLPCISSKEEMSVSQGDYSEGDALYSLPDFKQGSWDLQTLAPMVNRSLNVPSTMIWIMAIITFSLQPVTTPLPPPSPSTGDWRIMAYS